VAVDPNEIKWFDDGHVLRLRLDKSEVEVIETICLGLESRACQEGDTPCLVRLFVDRYGLECHVGSCPAVSELAISWTLLGDRRNLDAAQVWFLANSDEAFAAWLVVNR